MKKIWSKVKLFVREVGNFLTNLLCPVISAITAGMELCQLPMKWIEFMKKAEYWCWQACGTKDTIDKIIDKVDEVIEEEQQNKE